MVAYGRTEEEVAEHIGADAVIYQTLPDLIKSCSSLSGHIKNFEVGVFNGQYVTPVDPSYFKRLEDIRGETSKMKRKEAAIKAVAASIANEGDVVEALKMSGAKVNGHEFEATEEESERARERVRERMDVSIHNFGDYGDVGREGGSKS